MQLPDYQPHIDGLFRQFALSKEGALLRVFYVVLSVIVLSASTKIVYNLLFHKLAGFPGPLLARSTLIWRIYYSLGGRFHVAIDEQHRKYGPVVRISPNELSFASVESWKAIYGLQPPGTPTPIKSEFYDIYGAGFSSLCIGSERNPQKHSQMRKMLSAAFATKALVEQEAIFSNVVDQFITSIGQLGGSDSKGINMSKWFEMVSFDILGEMAFGESFHCIDTGKPHFWSELITSHLYFITLVDNLRRFPMVVALTKLLFPSTLAVRNQNSEYSRKQVAKRLEKDSTRKDFLSTVVKNFRAGNVSKEEMTAHVSTLTIAGGETVSTCLAGTTYYLLRNPGCLAKLQREIVDRFTSWEEINGTAARQLPYLQAVINEGLRMYPPGPQGFPRLSPGMKVGDYWVPEGAEVYTSAYTVTHDEQYFAEPMKFKPERWLDPHSTDVKEASQPFSLGTRGCLGQNFAYMELNLILAKMIWKYNLELVNKDLDWEGQSHMHVMWWKPKLMVRFTKRA
ncbi:cytochrome P450 [Aspergillus campestris IBT 28561]|uniref:Cytochrome P450 n=1 Tax=Aspergillus campestris (strain IBT 28561) TaxID=1392248 RepID=A0A2I1CR42_ASPC2|nr:cytochrome P450 [Aspergillus campestris IBT 28561]PKY00096.1 cytochrome P450 [Aspergillus campestris IBT 28561]